MFVEYIRLDLLQTRGARSSLLLLEKGVSLDLIHCGCCLLPWAGIRHSLNVYDIDILQKWGYSAAVFRVASRFRLI